MRIEFDPTNPDEAAAVRAMLTAMHPRVVGGPIPPGQNIGAPDRGPEIFVPNNGKITIPRLDMATGQWGTSEVSTATPTVAEVNDQIVAMVDTDSTGTPWDERIHSTPPTTNKDGTWRAKRGVKAEEIAAVKAEREALEAGYERIESPVEVVMDVHAQEQSAPNAPAGEQSAPPAPPAPTGQSEAPLAPVSNPSEQSPTNPSFLDVMKAITAAQKDGKIDTAKVKELCAAVGAGESTMGLNGPDNGERRAAYMALLGETINA